MSYVITRVSQVLVSVGLWATLVACAGAGVLVVCGGGWFLVSFGAGVGEMRCGALLMGGKGVAR